jgi:Tol biopolymer transport system component
MTADTRFDRDLTAILEDLYLGPSPDYRDEAMAAAVRTGQRPSWTFAGRWIPMADIASRPALAPRVPLRTIGMALLVIALVIAAAALIVGARQTKVPPPFGLARNGLITYAAEGDIYTVDPVSETTAAIVAGPAVDSEPVFSHDGTHIAFRRASIISGSPADDLVVVKADGSNPVVVTAKPIPGGPGRFEWAPDSRSLLVGAAAHGNGDAATLGTPADEGAVWLFDASGATPPRVLAANAFAYTSAFEPPDGKAILINRPTDTGQQMLALDLASGHETLLASGRVGDDLGAARWSPDGTQVVYNSAPALDPDSQRLFIVNADGSGTTQITNGPGVAFDIDASWSPDGSRIAFGRYERVGSDWLVQPTQLYTFADGSVRAIGPMSSMVRAQEPNPADHFTTAGEGMYPEWSPDGAWVIAYPSEATGHPVLINPQDGSSRILPQLISPSLDSQVWQRLAN